MILNILTRTARRPMAFERCVRSIKLQLWFEQINHIVGVEDDDKISLEYVLELGLAKRTVVKYPNRWRLSDNYWNLALHDMYREVKPGMVMILDDDDLFINDSASERILKLAGDDRLVTWGDNENMSHCAFPSKHTEFIRWAGLPDDSKRLMTALKERLTESNLSDNLTSVQAGLGEGLREDVPDAAVISSPTA